MMMPHHLSSLLSLSALFIILSHSNGQMSCGPRMSPRLLMDIPCDMTKSSFCATPGSAYPWASVRRYIFDNQGFMRRMYGDERQSLVLQNEIEEIRDKYDSIYFYGRTRNTHKGPSFGPRSMQDQDFQVNNSTTESSPPVNSSNYDIRGNISAYFNQSDAPPKEDNKESPSSDDESFDDTEFDMTVPVTTTTKANDESDESPNPSPYIDLWSISSPSMTTTVPSSTTEKDEENLPKKGVNACPVKDEVIAPYWANNTRGETLALLNVYPFEQYVHWEKCAYENTQMFCREGCRCEQQYRLHRLLAFDPKNDCRGVFADWFRFPSCCVCICYNLPETGYFRYNRRRARL